MIYRAPSSAHQSWTIFLGQSSSSGHQFPHSENVSRSTVNQTFPAAYGQCAMFYNRWAVPRWSGDTGNTYLGIISAGYHHNFNRRLKFTASHLCGNFWRQYMEPHEISDQITWYLRYMCELIRYSPVYASPQLHKSQV